MFLLSDRDLLVAKERLQFEVATQRSTVQEQRAQISILDSALTYAQTNVLKYEEEVNHHILSVCTLIILLLIALISNGSMFCQNPEHDKSYSQ